MGTSLQLAPEGDFPGGDGIVEPVSLVGVLAAQFDQLPHQLISFGRGQLVPRGRIGIIASGTEVVDIGSNTGMGIVGDADVDVSLFHVRFLPFCSLLGTLI